MTSTKQPRPKPPKLTIAQVETIERVWLATANASEAGREAGCSEASARRYIIRRGLPKADDLYAQALARSERQHLSTAEKARQKIDAALDSATAVKDIVALGAQALDGLRASTTTKMAHAKMTGKLVDKHEHAGAGGSPLTIIVPAQIEP